MGKIEWLAELARRYPSQIMARTPGVNGDREATYDEVLELSLRVAGGLASAGVRRGGIVGVWLPNCLEWVTADFACSALGAALLGINTRYRVEEVAHLLRVARPTAIVMPSRFLDIDFLGILTDALSRIGAEGGSDLKVPTLVLVGEEPAGVASYPGRHMTYGDIEGGPAISPEEGIAGERSNLFTTSGSTALPKLAGHPQSAVVTHAKAGAGAFSVVPGDGYLALLPLCGVFGYNAAMATVAGGGWLALEPNLDPVRSATLIEGGKITHLVGGDDLWTRVMPAVRNDSGVRLRRGGVADFTRRAAEVVEEAERRWGTRVSGVYGSSELFALTATWPESLDLELRSRQGGVVVSPGIAVRVAGDDGVSEVEPGQAGELQFSGYNVMEGYLNNPEATAAAFTADGWFRSGDLGYLDTDGGFVYLCRAKEALRLRGFLVEPAEIERFFNAVEGVEETHVAGVDTPSGTKVVAYVTLQSGAKLAEEDLLTKAKAELAAFKVPERLVIIDDFPATVGTNGRKVRVEVLREWATALLSDQSAHR